MSFILDTGLNTLVYRVVSELLRTKPVVLLFRCVMKLVKCIQLYFSVNTSLSGPQAGLILLLEMSSMNMFFYDFFTHYFRLLTYHFCMT